MASAAPAFPSTKETTNYARLCRLLVDVGTQVLRESFDRIHPPANLHAVLKRPAEHSVLQTLRKKRILNITQWGKLYPAITLSVSSRDFDITLLMVLLRNICGLVSPVTGWDNLPAAADVSTEADITRVKFYRNTVYGHASQASVDDAAFENYWTEIRDTLVRLGGASYEAAIDNLKDDCMDPEIEKYYIELLKQWEKDEEDIKKKLDDMTTKLDGMETKLESLINGKERMRHEGPLDVKECQAQLCAHYNACMSQVRRTPWDPDNTEDIDDIYTNLSWFKDERKGRETPMTKLKEYTDIFKGHKRFTNPKRMLVYGRPGIGKSTFSQKIAVDWANGEGEALKKFDLFLLIKLRDVGGMKGLPSMIKASKLLASDGPVSMDSLYEYVLQNQDKVLIMFDGYDEYSAGESSPIREIWEGSQLRDCHVIVTTRQMEGEELVKSSHVQCEIRGFDSREQVNAFASKFITSPKEIEEFDQYLDSKNLWEIAEIPLLLLMLCLIWMERHREALPKSKLELHERFVKTLLSHMRAKDQKDSRDEVLYTILDHYREDLTEIGKLALDGLLRKVLYIDLKDAKLQRSSFSDKMICSGLFQFSKLTSGEPNLKMFFLHKSVQEFLAAWYIMNEAGLTEGKVDCFTNIDSMEKIVHLQEILKFMCEWSEEGAKAVFSLLKFIGEKEELTECEITKTPSMNDLSNDQTNFRQLSLECLLSCSASVKQVMYPLFLSSIGGVVLVNITKLGAEASLMSTTLPNYLFFEDQVKFADVAPILDALRVVIVTSSGQKLEATNFFRKHCTSSKFPRLRFFLKKSGEIMYLYFIEFYWMDKTPEFVKMLRDLTTACTESHKKQLVDHPSIDQDKMQNCLSLVSDINCTHIETSDGWTVLSDVLSAVAFPRRVFVSQDDYLRLFDAQVVKNDVSHISFTDNLSVLKLNKLNLAADNAAIITRSLHRAPNLEELDLSDSSLYESVSELAENLQHVPRLTRLTLSRVGMGCQECESLATSLKHVPQLECLDLSHNSLGNGIIKLAENLKSVPWLRFLLLFHTNMGEKGTTALAQALKYAPELQLLYLGENPLRRGVSVLIQHLSSLSNLEVLDLRDVVMTKKELGDVTNANGKTFINTSYHDRQGNLKPESEWPVIDPATGYFLSPMHRK